MKTENGYELTLSLIRHGRTPMNEERRYIGRTDQSLSENGREQLRELAWTVRYPEGELLFVSPMKRARESAEILYPGREQIVIEDFRELDFGDFEGRNYQELKSDAAYRAWIDSMGSKTPPGCSETMEEYRGRLMDGLGRLLKLAEDKGAERVNAVVHGGVIMALVSACTGCGYYDNQVKNGAGVTAKVSWEKDEEGTVKISRFELADRFGPGSDHR